MECMRISLEERQNQQKAHLTDYQKLFENLEATFVTRDWGDKTRDTKLLSVLCQKKIKSNHNDQGMFSEQPMPKAP